MANPVILGIDVGTESSRAAIIRTDGSIMAVDQLFYSLVSERPGWASQDPALWWESTVKNIRNVIDKTGVKASDIAGVGAGGQMHGPVPIDADGEVISPDVQLWCDKRCEPQCSAVAERSDVRELARRAGNPIAPSWSGFKIAWVRDNYPDVYRRTATFVTPKDYINFRLSGERRTDYSEASGSYLMDAHTRTWSPELAEELGVDLAKMPPIAAASEVIGGVTAEAARATGLIKGTPVVAGGGDMPCTLLAAGIVRPGRACDITGTAAHVSVFSEAPLLDPRLMNLHHLLPGWFTFGILDSGGGSLAWFKNNFCQEEVALAAEKGESVYNLLAREAAQVPAGSGGLLFLPYLMGERTLGTAYSRGVFFGLSAHHTKAHLIRSIMEGVTFDLRQSLDIMRELGIQIHEIRVIGGGARSALWRQIKADIYQAATLRLADFEGGVLGAGILAATGAGIYGDLAAVAGRMLSIEDRTEPNPENMAVYDKFYNLYHKLHDELQPRYVELGDIL